MTKAEFLTRLQANLNGLSDEEINKSLEYYTEMIEDSVEDGQSEEEAVATLGSPDEAARRIRSELKNAAAPAEAVSQETAGAPVAAAVGEAPSQKENDSRTLTIVLLAVTSVVWFPVYISLWACVISLYICGGSFMLCGLVGIGAGIAALANLTEAGLYAGVGLILLSVGMLLIPLGTLCFKGLLKLSAAVVRQLKA